jgi:hypothetical protein
VPAVAQNVAADDPAALQTITVTGLAPSRRRAGLEP